MLLKPLAIIRPHEKSFLSGFLLIYLNNSLGTLQRVKVYLAYGSGGWEIWGATLGEGVFTGRGALQSPKVAHVLLHDEWIHPRNKAQVAFITDLLSREHIDSLIHEWMNELMKAEFLDLITSFAPPPIFSQWRLNFNVSFRGDKLHPNHSKCLFKWIILSFI